MNATTLVRRQNEGAGRSSGQLRPDIALRNFGSIVLFVPRTQAARDWMAAHCPADSEHTYWAGALVVEPRYVESLLAHARQDGLNTPQL